MIKFIDVVVPPLRETFTYSLPDDFGNDVQVGTKVEIPFGRRRSTGYVVSCPSLISTGDPRPTYKIKSIHGVVGRSRWFEPNTLDLFRWVADYYGESLASVIDAAIPPAAPPKMKSTIWLIDPDFKPSGNLQRELIAFLRDKSGTDSGQISKQFKGSQPALRNLQAKGVIRIDSEEVIDQHLELSGANWAPSDLTLNEPQQEALQKISALIELDQFHSILLHGLTGSGKTEVYIEAARAALSAGKGALIIVPEIALTPQLIDRFRARLGNQIAVLHSALQRRVRWDSWRALVSGRNSIAIGARSAIFAPVPNLGLVIVDEEHDSSYKQSEGMRYNARDLAVVRGKLQSCPVVLGSATPSLETFHNALTKKYMYLTLPRPTFHTTDYSIEIVDLSKIKPWEMKSKNISPMLYQALIETVERGDQAFILYNRRGFASYLQCDKCEAVVDCPNCSVTLTYHQKNHSLLCHYCNLRLVPTEYCPKCVARLTASTDPLSAEGTRVTKKPGHLVQRGAGTEKIFDEIAQLFPHVVLDRLDRDSADNIDSYREILSKVREGKTQVLIGTQMIAKGHDLPNVTLVGVADCDVGLHMPDFRAGERVFQLLTQVAGRAGRSAKPGKVILQTRAPNHPALIRTSRRDFVGFAQAELRSRQELNYPPFSRILRVISYSESKILPAECLKRLKDEAQKFIDANKLKIAVLGPSPAPLIRLKANWRWHLLFKSGSISHVQKLMKVLKSIKFKGDDVRVTFDLDPQEMM